MNKQPKEVQKPTSYDSDDEDYVPKGISDEDFNEHMEFFKNHPLFMKELPKDIESNPTLSALQTIIYDDTPVNIAQRMNVYLAQ